MPNIPQYKYIEGDLHPAYMTNGNDVKINKLSNIDIIFLIPTMVDINLTRNSEVQYFLQLLEYEPDIKYNNTNFKYK